MSAPRTNIEKQKRRHRGPLVGMIAVVIFALGLLFWLTMRTADEGQPVERNAPQIDSRTGEEIEPEPLDPTGPSGTPAVPEDGVPPGSEPEPDLPPQPLPGDTTTTP